MRDNEEIKNKQTLTGKNGFEEESTHLRLLISFMEISNGHVFDSWNKRKQWNWFPLEPGLNYPIVLNIGGNIKHDGEKVFQFVAIDNLDLPFSMTYFRYWL